MSCLGGGGSLTVRVATVSMNNMILFRYRAPGLPLDHPDCSRIFTEHGQRLCAPRHCYKSTANRAHGTVAANCSGPQPHLPPRPASSSSFALKLQTPKRRVWVKHNVRLARSSCNSAPWLNFGICVFKYCVRGPISRLKHP